LRTVGQALCLLVSPWAFLSDSDPWYVAALQDLDVLGKKLASVKVFPLYHNNGPFKHADDLYAVIVGCRASRHAVRNADKSKVVSEILTWAANSKASAIVNEGFSFMFEWGQGQMTDLDDLEGNRFLQPVLKVRRFS
jgi:hypothetical protein